MLYFCLFVTCILCFNILCCYIYCSVQEKRNDTRLIKSSNKDTISKKSNKRIFLAAVVRLLNLASLLRLNLFIVSYIPSHTIRNFLYRRIFKVKMAKNAVIYYGAEIRAPWNLHIDDGSIIGDKSILDARNGIYIGKNVNFSTGVWLWTEQHGVNNQDFSCDGEGGSIVIKDRAWLSCRTIVLPNITIEEGAVVAAGGVVTKNLEPFGIYGGIPAKKIGERNKKINYNFNGNRMHYL